MIDILKRMKDGEEISKEDDDLYDKKCVEYVKRTGSRLGLRKNFKDDDVDADVETETKPEKPKKETPQEKHNDDAYKTENEDGNTIYVLETIDYKVFQKSMKIPNHTFKYNVDKVIADTYSANKRLNENIEDPKFQKKFQDFVSETVGVKFENGEMDYEDFKDNNSHVPSDQIDEYNNWSQAVHYTFAKHPEKFEGIDGSLDEAIELQKELNEVRKKNFDEADYLWRGMNIEELEHAGEGIEEGAGLDQSWSLDPEESQDFVRSGEEAGNTMIMIRVPKETSGMYDVNYSVLKEGDDFEKFTSQGLDYLKEQEYRLKGRDMSGILDTVVMVNDYGMSEEERKGIRERISLHKVVFRRLD